MVSLRNLARSSVLLSLVLGTLGAVEAQEGSECNAAGGQCGSGSDGSSGEEGAFSHPSWADIPEEPKQPSQPRTWPGEFEALQSFYEAAGGETWRFNDLWLSDAPLGEWPGVKTDEEGHVVSLNMVKNQLSGIIPPSIGSLRLLESINLSRNRKLGGTLPSTLGQLTNLKDLHIYNAALTGKIPSEIGRLTGLTALAFTKNKLTGEKPMDDLIKLTELTYIDLRGNAFDLPSGTQTHHLECRFAGLAAAPQCPCPRDFRN